MTITLKHLVSTALAFLFAHQAMAAAETLRRIDPDASSRTSKAVVVPAAASLAHTVQILPRDAQGTIDVSGQADKQAEAVLDRLAEALGEAKAGLDDLVKLNVYAARPEAIAAFKTALARRLRPEAGPAICSVVGALAEREALLAVDAVATTPLTSRAGEVIRLKQLAILPPGGRVYVSGQADRSTDLVAATRKTLEQLETTLKHLRLDRSSVVQLKAFLSPISAAADVQREVAAFFGEKGTPPLVLVEWRSQAPPIEIELIAASGPAGGTEPIDYITPPTLKPSPVFSRVARVNRGDLVYVSGLYGPGDSSGEEQVELIFGGLGRILASAGSDFKHLVKATYYVSDDEASVALNNLRPRYYLPTRPPTASKALVAAVGGSGQTVTVDMIAVARPQGSPGRSERDARLPNVLLLLSDDQRPDTIAALGNRSIRTPNLDRLVRAGTTFTRAVSPNPLCNPSRAEILSGCTGFRNGVLPGFTSQFAKDLVLWPEAMRRAGYATWYTGKWHTPGRPLTSGYVESQGMIALGGPTEPRRLDTKGRAITGYVGAVFQSDDGRKYPELGVGLTPETPARIADAAIGFIRRKPEKPFFLHVNFTAPHDPLLPPKETESLYDPADLPVPGNFLAEHPFDYGNLRGRDELLWPWPRTPRMVREEMALYYAVITDLDTQIGRILSALDETGEAERTIVIFTSDQGLAIGSHGIRGKQNMYEHTVTTPLVIVGPGLARDRHVRAQVYLRDLYPTVCELTGVAVPAGLDGQSMASVLRGGDDRGHPLIFGYFMDTERMVRGDRWKLIRYPRIAREQLFDLAADPLEMHDLAAVPEHAAVVEELRVELLAWQKRNHDPLLSEK